MGKTQGPGEYDTPSVRGEILVSASISSFAGAAVHIWLEDVSYADRAAVVVGETVVSVGHEHAMGVGRDTRVVFCVRPTVPIDPAHDYSIRVWLDRDADGKPGSGDLWSDQSHRVLTRGATKNVVVNLVERKG